MTSGPGDVGSDEEPASLQFLLEVDQPQLPAGPDWAGCDPSVVDLVAFLRQLEASLRFHRDTGFGRIFHPGRFSLRENVPTDSLHVIVDENHIAAHVDRVSPLGVRPQRRMRYSVWRTAAHNLAGMAEGFVRLVRGRQGDHRSELDCEWLRDPSHGVPRVSDLLDPQGSAWSVQMEARVGGVLDEARLRRALVAVLGRQSFDHDPLWVVGCPDQASLDSARAQLQSHPAEMTAWPPLRAALVRRRGGDVFMLNVNHATADGVGALQLMRGIASSYATGNAPQPPLDLPAVGDLPVRPASPPVSVGQAHYHAAVERLRDLLARPAQLAPDGGSAGPAFGFHLVCLSDDQTRRVVDVDRPGTSRHIMLAGLHLAIGEWNARHGAPGRRVGVLVPVNLRPPEWPEQRVGNFSVTARVSTSRRHRRGPAAALKAVTAQTTRNRRSRTGTALLAALERSGLVPLWCKQSVVVLQSVTRNYLVDTALLANLGGLEEAPSFGGEAGETLDVWLSLPARTPLTLCVGAIAVSGRLHLVVRYPSQVFSAEAASRFTDCLVAEMARVADSRSGRRYQGPSRGVSRADPTSRRTRGGT